MIKDICRDCGKALRGFRYQGHKLCAKCGKAMNNAKCLKYQNQRYKTDASFREKRKAQNKRYFKNKGTR
jgi:hypothetical protein